MDDDGLVQMGFCGESCLFLLGFLAEIKSLKCDSISDRI